MIKFFSVIALFYFGVVGIFLSLLCLHGTPMIIGVVFALLALLLASILSHDGF